MSDIAFVPAKLPVIATFEKTCRAFLKALGPLALLMLPLLGVLGVLCAGVIALAKPMAKLVAFALERGLNLVEPHSTPFWLAMAPLILVFLGVFIAVALRFTIAAYKLADASTDGRTLKFMDILRDPRPGLVDYFLLSLVVGILTFLGAILFIVPGIIIALALWLAPLAMIFEGKDVSGSLQRSRDLTRNNRWRLLGLYVLSALMFLPASLLTSFPLESDPDTAFSLLRGLLLILNFVISILQAIFMVVLTVTIYRELRALKDRPAEVVAPEPAPEPSPAA
jgi:hypothetical protein